MNLLLSLPAKLVFVFVPLCGTLAAGVIAAEDPEPARVLVLSINGTDYTVEEGKEEKLNGALANATVKIRPAGYRIFKHDGLSFRYPVDLAFEADHDGNYRTWNISGQDSDLDIMIVPDNPESYIKESVALTVAFTENPDQRPKIKKGKYKFKGRELPTYHYTVAWDEEMSMQTWAVELPRAQGKSRVLMFGLYFDEKGQLSEECVSLKKMVFDSLSF